MPVGFDFFERLFLQRLNKGPAPMLDLVAMLGFKATRAALEVGLFEALADASLTLPELATKAGASERGLRFLLEAIEPLGYVAREGERWRNTPMTERWLLRRSPECLADLFSMFEDMAARWDSLGAAVKTGQTALDVGEWLAQRPDGYRNYHAGLRAVARLLADEIAAKVPIAPSARRLLDLGGSHALYSVRLCQSHPELRATVFDLESARASAEETIREHSLGEHVTFQPGDFLRDPVGEGWDVVLLFAVARTLAAAPVKALLARICAATAPGGTLVLMDQLAERLPSPFMRANAKLISLELLNSSPGELHTKDQLQAWALEAGFASVRYFDLRRSGGQGVIVASKA